MGFIAELFEWIFERVGWGWMEDVAGVFLIANGVGVVGIAEDPGDAHFDGEGVGELDVLHAHLVVPLGLGDIVELPTNLRLTGSSTQGTYAKRHLVTHAEITDDVHVGQWSGDFGGFALINSYFILADIAITAIDPDVIGLALVDITA